jgi:hypothetical protein
VEELTDDKSLPKRQRKRLQIEHAPHLSICAKQIKIEDKVCNLGDITLSQPVNWPLQRKREYLEFAERVVAGRRGCSPQLERHFEAVVKEKRKTVQISRLSVCACDSARDSARFRQCVRCDLLHKALLPDERSRGDGKEQANEKHAKRLCCSCSESRSPCCRRSRNWRSLGPELHRRSGPRW